MTDTEYLKYCETYFNEYKKLCYDKPEILQKAMKRWIQIEDRVQNMSLKNISKYADYITTKMCNSELDIFIEFSKINQINKLVNECKDCKVCVLANIALIIMTLKNLNTKELLTKFNELYNDMTVDFKIYINMIKNKKVKILKEFIR